MTIHPIFFFLRIPVSQFTSDIHVQFYSPASRMQAVFQQHSIDSFTELTRQQSRTTAQGLACKTSLQVFVNSCLAHPIWTISLSSACVQFDFVKLLDGKALPRSLTEPVLTAKAPKGLLLSGLQETGFIEYMDPGTWHLALYNDGRNLEQVLLHSTPIGEENNVVAFSSLFSKNVLCAYFIVCFPHST